MKINVWKAVSIAIIVIFASSTIDNVYASASEIAIPPSISVGNSA